MTYVRKKMDPTRERVCKACQLIRAYPGEFRQDPKREYCDNRKCQRMRVRECRK